eukprot:6079851-Amphidinium_carterae.2
MDRHAPAGDGLVKMKALKSLRISGAVQPSGSAQCWVLASHVNRWRQLDGQRDMHTCTSF